MRRRLLVVIGLLVGLALSAGLPRAQTPSYDLVIRHGRVVDAAGIVVAPGFIDLHTHARRGIFDVPTADNYVRQGVTTLVEGPDGSSPIPLAPFLAKLEALPKSINI